LSGVIREPVRATDKHHIAGKPTAVLRQLVRVCPPGGTVLDPFAGSGTTGVAALLEGRQFVGVEISEEYTAIARERLLAADAGIGPVDFRAGQQRLFGGLRR
jgi:site-specific DNA-methyltransferase (adenine-specific)